MSLPKRLLTIEEAAEYLTIHRSLMYRLLKEGAVSSISIGRCRRVPISELDAFLDSQMTLPSTNSAWFPRLPQDQQLRPLSTPQVDAMLSTLSAGQEVETE